MAFQRNITRRKFLMASIVAMPMGNFILSGISAAEATELAAPDLDDYKPSFFTQSQWKFILAATDQLIPAGGNGKAPGALETNVPVFIDQQLNDSEFGKEIYMQGPFHTDLPKTLGYQIPFYPQQIYRTAIKITDQWCKQQFGHVYAELSNEQKQQVLSDLQADKINFQQFGENALTAGQFFSQLLSDTQNGYLSDPMYGGNKGMKAWIALGFPGARASFTEWVKQHNVPYTLGPVSLQGDRA
ncbi:gluconate 2-dehydrogenase subunit 3 family protein [Vibrio sp. CAIM 722]|uniref:Gluconate 2-dehydrogenase subunit 3 family protein n=1 Tax=Vibrio eleionomae TaxID=2653505 RepID=A0A7X4LHT3_9VIBR|nr:gluconate 2-dehydrogenase subunit 3 family protein [Vibrio eleionomae]MZI91902.1 gluconate 2-dehydrogenase subunit 3 family protein [Vibrio eleionomae]